MTIPVVLSIAGSDSGGGAGIQADLKTCQELGVFATSAITAITAQNTVGVHQVKAIEPEMVYAQADAVLADIGANVIKTGMLVGEGQIKVVSQLIDKYTPAEVVVDPVISSTSGTQLLTNEGLAVLRKQLLPKTTLLTPNLPEAALLLNQKEPKTIAEMKEFAIQLHQLGPRAIVLKGGHLEGDAVDLFYDGREFIPFSAARIKATHTHGTGCTFAAAIAAELAKGSNRVNAVRVAKAFITKAIKYGFELGEGKGPTNHAAYRQQLDKE
ncbi:hydroxymethylpyrimidine/phosphomethylpyrimidine kinase [Alkalihalobacillus xiaoxiensis]|uniref:Hydroxymethylpyrimidine/phosphomethylpyrimidine kinase n=1 Tax=Shouchella xiaoxiensis TaxID=766895 RepID=A0ABS2SSI1_9BACI|nr:bifunctional hydroxymethylpyrimidine kinase/phosphomethylpyrimidine kinase [Shouchella xiaoxiensis]MBM7838156.1 hydroxymethylpyrimidine/phosphomethylpyrimidine kinase [Shouchella xiaoxiensis]